MSSPTADQKTELLGLTQDELRDYFITLGEKPYRARQLCDAIYRRRITVFDALTDLPKTLRGILEERTIITRTHVESVFISSDGTRRLLLKLGDNSEVESVFMPEERRDTICMLESGRMPAGLYLLHDRRHGFETQHDRGRDSLTSNRRIESSLRRGRRGSPSN